MLVIGGRRSDWFSLKTVSKIIWVLLAIIFQSTERKLARLASDQIRLEYQLVEDQEELEKLRKARERLEGLEGLNLPVKGKEFLVDSNDVIFLLLANGDVFVSKVILKKVSLS